MQVYELTHLLSQRADSNKAYLEFLKVPDLSMGVYVLPAPQLSMLPLQQIASGEIPSFCGRS